MDAARCRQELRTRLQEIPTLLEPAFEHTSLLAANVYIHRYRCGKPTCHCANGSLHEYWSLATWRHGKNSLRRVQPNEDLLTLQAAAQRYRSVRSARALFVKWSRRVLRLLDALETARSLPPRPPRKSAARHEGGSR